ncbi:MAG: oligosaccharide flippase family protein [Porphyromonadaceae bacterium]|nr:oligosaccharide flippase family protein [Porphyromonadaceae bacterium]
MSGMKSLAKDTAVYGLSSIVGRFLNWCLVPLYTHVFTQAEYGVVTYLYSLVAVLLIILTYGLETGFFRFINHEKYKDSMQVYSTGLISLACTSVIFILVVGLFLDPISSVLGSSGDPRYVMMLAVTLAIDAFTAMPFAYLRYKQRPFRFAGIKLLSIFLNIGLNIFFIILCPILHTSHPGWIASFYRPDFGVGYIFLSNLVASAVTLLVLAPEIVKVHYRFNVEIWRNMIVYSFPLLIMGLAGIMNQTIDKIIYPLLVTDTNRAMAELGVYGANYKIAIVMVMFIQAFRFAYEPFIFAKSRSRGEESQKAYVDAMHYFIIFGLLIFLGVMFYLPVLKYFISPRYFSGLSIVPIVMAGEFFFGIFFNLSLWYKLTDRTYWGTIFSVFGLIITLLINILFVPRYGYTACAWAAFCCYFSMMAVSYCLGEKYYPIPYRWKAALQYVLIAIILYIVAMAVPVWPVVETLLFRTALLLIFIVYAVRRDIPLAELPFIGKYFKKNL